MDFKRMKRTFLLLRLIAHEGFTSKRLQILIF